MLPRHHVKSRANLVQYTIQICPYKGQFDSVYTVHQRYTGEVELTESMFHPGPHFEIIKLNLLGVGTLLNRQIKMNLLRQLNQYRKVLGYRASAAPIGLL